MNQWTTNRGGISRIFRFEILPPRHESISECFEFRSMHQNVLSGNAYLAGVGVCTQSEFFDRRAMICARTNEGKGIASKFQNDVRSRSLASNLPADTRRTGERNHGKTRVPRQRLTQPEIALDCVQKTGRAAAFMDEPRQAKRRESRLRRALENHRATRQKRRGDFVSREVQGPVVRREGQNRTSREPMNFGPKTFASRIIIQGF